MDAKGSFKLDNVQIIDVTDVNLHDILQNTDNMAIFVPNVMSYNDYYPYEGGAFKKQPVAVFSERASMRPEMPNRHANSDRYRYGFQSLSRTCFGRQEKDDEIKGIGNSLNYKYRMHDPRVGRFFAIDPLAAKYPYNSTYAFSENVVINAVELEGLEKKIVVENYDMNWKRSREAWSRMDYYTSFHGSGYTSVGSNSLFRDNFSRHKKYRDANYNMLRNNDNVIWLKGKDAYFSHTEERMVGTTAFGRYPAPIYKVVPAPPKSGELNLMVQYDKNNNIHRIVASYTPADDGPTEMTTMDLAKGLQKWGDRLVYAGIIAEPESGGTSTGVVVLGKILSFSGDAIEAAIYFQEGDKLKGVGTIAISAGGHFFSKTLENRFKNEIGEKAAKLTATAISDVVKLESKKQLKKVTDNDDEK